MERQRSFHPGALTAGGIESKRPTYRVYAKASDLRRAFASWCRAVPLYLLIDDYGKVTQLLSAQRF
jgi:hypothetical protein